jgi:hypothetical protein
MIPPSCAGVTHNASEDVTTLAGAVDGCNELARQLIGARKFSPCRVTTIWPLVGPLLGLIPRRIAALYVAYLIVFDMSAVFVSILCDTCKLTSPIGSDGVTHLSALDVITSAGTSIPPKSQ